MNRNLLRRAQQMQVQLAKAQEELESATVQASSGGGAVTVICSGKLRIESVSIDASAVDPSDVGLLEDLFQAAANESLEKAHALAAEKMGSITGGLNIAGL